MELESLNFVTVGLGDRAYVKFNWAARMCGKRLRGLGAREVWEGCEADEGGEEGVEGGVNEWLGGFQKWLGEQWPIEEGIEGTEVVDAERWTLRRANEIHGEVAVDGQRVNGEAPVNGVHTNGNHTTTINTISNGAHPLPEPHPRQEGEFTCTLTLNQRLTPPTHFQDVRLLRLHTPSTHPYLPGDCLALLPSNSPTDVSTLLALQSWTPIADIPLLPVPPPTTMPLNWPYPPLATPPLPPTTPITLRALLTHHLDITAIPRRSFFGAIARFTDNEMHKERLLEFTNPEFLDEYFDYATRPRRSILEILQEFDSVKIPWGEVVGVFPVLRARLFSIASAYRQQPSEVDEGEVGGQGGTTFELLVAIVEYKTVIKKVRRGVCTRWLKRLGVGEEVGVALRTEGRLVGKGGVSGRAKHVLVGAGTGLAPLRSLVWEKEKCGRERGETLLVFGARNRGRDFFFEDEWERLQAEEEGGLRVVTAFSRDQDKKVYVQDRVRELGGEVVRLVRNEEAVIVVCGAAGQMPKAVRQALVDVLCEYACNEGDKMTAEEAEAYVERMDKEGRYKQETWS